MKNVMEYNKLEEILRSLIFEKYLKIEDQNEEGEKFVIEIFSSNEIIENRYQKITSLPDLPALLKDMMSVVEDFQKFSVCLFATDDDGINLFDLMIQVQKFQNVQHLDESKVWKRIKSFTEFNIKSI
jgi:hypothetical protein